VTDATTAAAVDFWPDTLPVLTGFDAVIERIPNSP
jgi:hypothetical protein